MSTGRPTKLDDIVAKRIVDAVAAGGSRSAAAEAARVHRSTLMLWLARGRKGEPPYSDFLDRVKKAEADAENAMVVIVRAAAEKNWTAAAWWLERRRPRLYALRRDPRTASTTPPIVQHVVSDDDVELLEGLAAAARSARGLADGWRTTNGKGRTNGNT
jgi:hypothetical protein